MPRSILLAVALTMLAWAATVNVVSPPHDVVTMSAAGAACETADAGGQQDPNQQWRASQRALTAVSESIWKSAMVHADLATTSSSRLLEPTRHIGAPAPPVPPVADHLRHTPLLI